ncbi:NAD(+) synthase [Celeribacter indicus]|uniref:Glutamine-dependent NAD(+) synthetase n=1 Tax=Celeribacter indicus TaxID=1208324 RepID=A0A0B5E010_9RHOB|nr:NAD(+) synthase [Celeribacter indicus]AJE45787.1 NAD synthetase [Celeribacter indicus]SDW60644.1 NAD+ synthase (glutamine-hydrolysing) [Celeribacter indicus]
MTGTAHAPFAAYHRHGFVRVATSTPRVRPADVAYNRDSLLEEMQRADRARADLLVCPELCLSSYAIDDLHMQEALLAEVETALLRLVEASAALSPVVLVGAPLRREGRLYNCAVAIARGRMLGVVPKSYLPNYREFYEKRWFAHGRGLDGEITVGGVRVPFGTDLIFEAADLPGLIFHVEICEDLWTPAPPSSEAAMAGALILANLSASNIVIGKSSDRHVLSQSQSMRAFAAYAYSAAGPGESTTDLSWDGQGMIYELGDLLAESTRFPVEPELTLADVDTGRILSERMRTGSFDDAARHHAPAFRRIRFDHHPHCEEAGLIRPVRRFPYVPNRESHLDQDCYEAFNIQVEGLRRRFEATRGRTMVIGVSGGLDSTHALIVAAKACDRMGLPRDRILAFTMPGFATSEGTKSNAWKLMRAMGVTAEEIDIRPAARQMLTDMNHAFARGEPVHDVTFENVQAGLRTDYLFRLANQRQGFVIGTGDLSELALGWCTYGVGDQMSHYAVNAGVPKTLIQYLIRWTTRSGQFDPETDRVLEAILATEISPELVPVGEDEEIQSTEAMIGPYELNDFFLFHIMRYGLPPSKTAFLAWHAWHDTEQGRWPEAFPATRRNAYDLATIRHWLERFLVRFFATSQFKRSALPNGPKVSAGGALSPRGDWRAPSDSVATPWLEELRANVPLHWPSD